MKWLASILVATAALIAPAPVTTDAEMRGDESAQQYLKALDDAQVPTSTAPKTQTKSTAPTLMPVVDRGDVARVQVLLAQGADPNEFEVIRGALQGPGFTSKSPLLLAVKRNDEPMARLLLAHGARARWRDANGMTVAEVARARKINDSLIELLSNAEKREFSLVPEWPLPEPLALAALRRVAGTKNDATAGGRLDSKLLRRVGDIVGVLTRTWTRPRDRPPVLAWSLTRDVNSLEWAIQNGSNEVLKAVVADLDTKRLDCLSSPDGAFGEVKISVRTLLTDGTERRGLRIRYIERFYWDLLPTVPAVASQWKELATTTSVVAEPLTAGDYVIVARSADGNDLSEAKPISVSRNRTAQFDVSLR